MKSDINISVAFILVLSIAMQFLLFSNVNAFYEHEYEEASIELRGLVRGFGVGWQNPKNDFLYEERSKAGVAGVARLIANAMASQNLTFEFNIYQTYIPISLVSSQAGLGTSLDVERSSALEISFSNDKHAHMAVDHLNARWSQDRIDLIVGRQPINLATTFYFTPNDFFAPFAAQAFYRVYKPGVDAIRANVRLGDLSQLSMIGVLGYGLDPESDTGWNKEPDSNRLSYIGHISTVFHDFDLALLGGVVHEADIIGGSLQGELFQWLGIRAEGHLTDPHDSRQASYSQVSVGLEHHWESSLDLRLEQFYNGRGSGSVLNYGNTSNNAQDRSFYMGRNYTAFGVGYEFTPLLNAQMLTIANWTDHSYLLSFYALYSLADEAELAINIGVPIGKKPQGIEIRSEFGLYPKSVNIEVRFFF